MSRIDRALAGNPFEIDHTQCMLAADAVSKFSPASAGAPWAHAPQEAQVVFKLFFVAICHQINWDFLQRRLFEQFFDEDAQRMLKTGLNASSDFIQETLGEYSKPERIRATERARYLRETANAVYVHFDGVVERIYHRNTIFGENSLFFNLKKIPAYAEDPLQKKTSAFAQELAREGIVSFVDADAIPPAIDYHLIRLYLRTGRVFATDPHVFNTLKTGTTHRPRLVKLLREKVGEALDITAAFARLPVHELNYLEWQIGRSRCEQASTNCDRAWPHELIDRSILELSAGCPYRTSCNAYAMPEWKAMLEPAFNGSFY